MKVRTSARWLPVRQAFLEAGLGLLAIDIDRLALALGVGREPAPREVAGGDDSGAEHDLRAIDSFDGDPVLVPLAAAAAGEGLSFDARQRELRAALERGFCRLSEYLSGAAGRPRLALANLLAEVEETRIALGGRRAGTSAAGDLIEVRLGTCTDSGDPVTWDANREAAQQTNANLRLTGVPGTGKTQVLLHIITSILRASPGTGLVLFDYKGDISRDPAFAEAVGAEIIRPMKRPIPVNPFQLPASVDPRLAPRAFADVFASVDGRLGPVQRQRLHEAMERAYGRAQVGGGGYPSLSEVRDAVQEVYEEEGAKRDSVTGILDELTNFGLFAERSERPVERVFEARWLIDLSELRHLKNLVAFVLLEFLDQAAHGLPDAPFERRSQCRTFRGIVAIDEAHHYLKRQARPLFELIRVGRSKGVPVFLASQSLDDFKATPELAELMPNNIILRQGLPPDAKVMMGALGSHGQTDARLLAEQTTRLDAFVALSSAAGGRPVELTPFYQSNPSPRTGP